MWSWYIHLGGWRKLLPNQTWWDSRFFNKDLAAAHVTKTILKRNRPTYVGFTVLDFSKTLISTTATSSRGTKNQTNCSLLIQIPFVMKSIQKTSTKTCNKLPTILISVTTQPTTHFTVQTTRKWLEKWRMRPPLYPSQSTVDWEPKCIVWPMEEKKRKQPNVSQDRQPKTYANKCIKMLYLTGEPARHRSKW